MIRSTGDWIVVHWPKRCDRESEEARPSGAPVPCLETPIIPAGRQSVVVADLHKVYEVELYNENFRRDSRSAGAT